jgi:hypothetical protein
MSWLKWIWDFLFSCHHRRTTWPHRNHGGLDYVCCLDCGKELPYSLLRMKIVSQEEFLQDRSQQAWEEFASYRARTTTLRAA